MKQITWCMGTEQQILGVPYPKSAPATASLQSTADGVALIHSLPCLCGSFPKTRHVELLFKETM